MSHQAFFSCTIDPPICTPPPGPPPLVSPPPSPWVVSRPGAGKVLRWQVPSTAVPFDHRATIRVDSGVSEGDTVGTNYGEIGGGGARNWWEGRKGGRDGGIGEEDGGEAATGCNAVPSSAAAGRHPRNSCFGCLTGCCYSGTRQQSSCSQSAQRERSPSISTALLQTCLVSRKRSVCFAWENGSAVMHQWPM